MKRSMAILFAALALLPIAGLAAAAYAECGLPIPHDHVLIGSAARGVLVDHQRAERHCQPAEAARETDDARVLSVLRAEGHLESGLLSLVQIVWMPAASLIALALIRSLVGRFSPPTAALTEVSLLPPTPPPRLP